MTHQTRFRQLTGRSAVRKVGLILALCLTWGWVAEALAPMSAWGRSEADMASEQALTQADIDGYVYLTPRLAASTGRDPDQAVVILKQSGLTRRRAVYVGAKIAIAQALASGLLSPGQLADGNVPLHLRPSTDEIDLVTRNLGALVQAQDQARQAAAQNGY